MFFLNSSEYGYTPLHLYTPTPLLNWFSTYSVSHVYLMKVAAKDAVRRYHLHKSHVRIDGSEKVEGEKYVG